jgi:hypothetical protein
MLTWEKTYGGEKEDAAYFIIQTSDGGYAVAGYTNSKGSGKEDAWIIKLDQQGNKVWDKVFGGEEYDDAVSIIQTSDGGYAVAGSTESKGAGEKDAWVIKLDKSGIIIWDKTFGGSDDDYAWSLIQTDDGGYAVAGLTSSKGAGEEDAWVIKLDDKGNMLWDKTYGGSEYDDVGLLIQTDDGGYAVAGWTESKGAGSGDIWIIKLDNKGNRIWDKTFGGSNPDLAWSLIQTDDGGYGLAGTTYSFGAGEGDFWIIKLDHEGNRVWDKTFGGSDDDYAWSLIQTDDGGYAVAGLTSSKGAGGKDAWVIKLDKSGIIIGIWDKTFGGSGDDRAHSIIQTSDGGYAVAGVTLSFGAGEGDFWLIKLDSRGNKLWDKTFGGSDDDYAWSLIQTDAKGAGEKDAWVIKLDKSGIIIWDKTFGGSDDDYAFSLIQTDDGGYEVAGFTSSKGAGEKDAWVIKLDKSGIIIWDKTFGGSGDDYALSLIQTDDGGYAVAGWTESKGAGGEDAWIIKLDYEGNIIWDRTYGGRNNDVALSLIQTDDGGYAVAGVTSSFGAGEGDFWIIKLDHEGSRVWDKTFGGSDDDWACSIIQHTDGSYIVAGYTNSKGAGGEDAWIIKLDYEGNIVWDRTYGGRNNDVAWSLIQTDDGGYAVAGWTESKGAGKKDAWVIKLKE